MRLSRLKPKTPRVRRILMCVGFNLLLELWVHGIGGFINPVLLISLFLLYLSYFMILTDLIIRLRLKDHHVLLIGFVYGLLQETLNTGSVFNDSFVAGVNPVNIFMANVLWWGILQSAFAWYFAVTRVPGDEEGFGRMGKKGWGFAVGINVFFFAVLALEGEGPEEATATGYLVSLILMLLALAALFLVKRPSERQRIVRVRFVDRLLRAQLVICVVMGILRTAVLGDIALYLFILWTVFTGVVYLVFILKGYRFVGRLIS